MKLILLDRGDRPHLTAWVKKRFKKYEIIHPDFEPELGKDIAKRLRIGCQEAGDDFVYIIENDDYYPLDYIEKLEAVRAMTRADWIGDTKPYYYHIRSRTWQHYPKMGVSGLWNMGFHTRIMKEIKWLNDGHISMDSWISKKAIRSPNIIAIEYTDHGGLGIKGHGIGMTGSIAHKKPFTNADPTLKWLIARTDQSFMRLHF